MNWDIYNKLLLRECPQDFVTYFVPGAHFVQMRESQFQTRGDGPYKPREMRGDGVTEAEFADQHFLMHIEWQADKDEEMDMRLLGYSYEAMRLHKLPVLSVVIYPQMVSDVPRAPLKRSIPTGRPVIWFDFDSLELRDQAVDTFRQLDLDAFYALMLLCKDGATYDVLEEVLTRLEQRKRKELISITRFFAGKVFTAAGDRERLARRFAMLRDFLQDSWTFQETLEEGREEGQVKEVRQNIEVLVEKRFPALLAWVKAQVEQITDLATLRKILYALFTAYTEEEAKRSLSAPH